jgi:aspartyl-tRNA(Asn)/glutamyl-tRNA(Gln) amidotransferase subunit B
MDYEVVIGLEVHAELRTNAKIFCGCSTAFGATPNTHVCPVCLGLPGALPVLNRKAVEYAVRAALAVDCTVHTTSKFHRKNYFYPDLPKAYQISQYDEPLATGGKITLADGNIIGITRIHMEEEAGKSVHQGDDIMSAEYSLEDLNRCGIGLIEIVSEPDIRSPQEAKQYLERLKAILQYIEVSDCKMEEGSLRCDANISLRPKGGDKLGTKAELKNLNSFRAVERALEYEVQRQTEVLNRAERVIQETRTWDEARGITSSMRSKEEAHDYRYFPEPDLLPVVLEASWIEEIRSQLPELPHARSLRFQKEYGLSEYDAELIVGSKDMAEFYEETVSLFPEPKEVANWLMVEVQRLLRSSEQEIESCKLTARNLAQLLQLVKNGTISGSVGKNVLEEIFATGKAAQEIVNAKGLSQISDETELREIIAKIVAENPKSVTDFKAGKGKAVGFLVGQVMKQTRGMANPQLTNKLLTEYLQRQ